LSTYTKDTDPEERIFISSMGTAIKNEKGKVSKFSPASRLVIQDTIQEIIMCSIKMLKEQILEMMYSGYKFEPASFSLFSNVSAAWQTVGLSLLQRLKLINLAFLYSHIESSSNQASVSENAKLVSLIEQIEFHQNDPSSDQSSSILLGGAQSKQGHPTFKQKKTGGNGLVINNNSNGLMDLPFRLEEVKVCMPIQAFMEKKEEICQVLRKVAEPSKTILCHLEVNSVRNCPIIKAGTLVCMTMINFKNEMLKQIQKMPEADELITVMKTEKVCSLAGKTKP